MEQKERCTAIVLAAGSGSRMKSKVAKQFMLLGDKPLIWYALHTIQQSEIIDNCILVTSDGALEYVRKQIVEAYNFTKVSSVIPGGAERYASVYQGIQELLRQGISFNGQEEYVFIHDGARPFLTEELLAKLFAAVCQYKACVAAVPVKDTIKIADREDFAIQTPSRSSLWSVQTPQVFEAGLITGAYRELMKQKEALQDKGIQITDDAMAVEYFGKTPVKMVEASYQNIKITTPEDLRIAEGFLGEKNIWKNREKSC